MARVTSNSRANDIDDIEYNDVINDKNEKTHDKKVLHGNKP